MAKDEKKIAERKLRRKIRRHKIWYWFLRPIAWLIVKCKFGYKYKKAKNVPDNYIVLANHTTDFDPIFVALGFTKQMYFVASEHITRWKTAYKLINHIFEPIVRYKGTIASSTVREVLRKTKNKQNVCIFAEGVRSWNGETSLVLPSTAKLVKSAGCGLVTYKISGGYFVSPNWSEGKTRKGRVTGAPVNVYTKEQIASMSDEELYKVITSDLYENAYDKQKIEMRKYKGKNLAERLENLMFICPNCRAYETLSSHKDSVKCINCSHEFKYNKYGFIENSKFETVYDMSEWQRNEVKIDVKKNVEYSTPNVTLSKINTDHTKEMLYTGELKVNTKEISCGANKFAMSEIIDMAIYGKRGIVFSVDNVFYEIIVSKPYNAYKYVLYYKENLEKDR